ncbi:hypothetical protein HaLaN_24763 [Haematococcus lacustris]|uniref:Uncharacterized protein n=1 Tax=Haematococcus lacustris TaxID=44745 RepID=A0A6A0A1T0_HAELA|nr:hypothetical protein HaLaN_24763 [Haematococcus lacustris]
MPGQRLRTDRSCSLRLVVCYDSKPHQARHGSRPAKASCRQDVAAASLLAAHSFTAQVLRSRERPLAWTGSLEPLAMLPALLIMPSMKSTVDCKNSRVGDEQELGAGPPTPARCSPSELWLLMDKAVLPASCKVVGTGHYDNKTARAKSGVGAGGAGVWWRQGKQQRAGWWRDSVAHKARRCTLVPYTECPIHSWIGLLSKPQFQRACSCLGHKLSTPIFHQHRRGVAIAC